MPERSLHARHTVLRRIIGAAGPRVPLTRREIRVLALLALVALSQGWAGNVLTHTLAATRETFDLSDQGMFDVQAVVRAVALIGLVFSWWSDHRGRRGPLLLAFTLLPLANLATAAVGSLRLFAATQAATRIGTVALGAIALVVLAEEVDPRVRGYAAGLFSLFLSMGTGWGLILSRVLDRGGETWRWLFGVSGITLFVFPFLALHLRESRAFRPGTPRPPLSAALRGGLARRFVPIALLTFSISAFTGPAANTILPRMVNDLGWDQSDASLLLVTTNAPAVLLGLLIGARCADHFGRKPTELAAILIGVSGGLGFYFFDEGWALGVGVFVSVLGVSIFAPAYAAQRAELFPTEVRATAGAWVVNASIVGGLFGFLAGRFVVDAWGLAPTMAGLGSITLVATTMLLLLPETKGISIIEGPEGYADRSGAMPA